MQFPEQPMPSNEDGARSEWIRQALAEYEGPLIRYAHRITCDREWAREVVQETFLCLCREDPRTIDSHLAKWLFLVCRNKALDVIRKERRMSPLASEHVLESPERNASPDHAAEQRDSAAQVIAFIGDNIFASTTLPNQGGNECVLARNGGTLEEGYLFAGAYLHGLNPDILVGGHCWLLDRPRHLGTAYESGEGVRKNTRLAAHWYHKAALGGDDKAQFNYGRCLLEGTGVAKNRRAALIWLRKAAARGNARARNALGESACPANQRSSTGFNQT